MNDEAARQSRSDTTSVAIEGTTAARREPTVEKIVAARREVAAATGFFWIYDLVVEEIDKLRLAERRAA